MRASSDSLRQTKESATRSREANPGSALVAREVPRNFVSANRDTLPDYLVPFDQAERENVATQWRLNFDSRYSSAIEYFEERHSVATAGFNELAEYCRSLTLASRIRDAYECAKTLEQRLYRFVQSGAARKFAAKQRELEALGAIPIVNIFADLAAAAEDKPLPTDAEENVAEFADVWLPIDFIKVRYYLAINDFQNAQAHARKQLAEHEVFDRHVGARFLGNAIPFRATGFLAAITGLSGDIELANDFNLGMSLAQGDEDQRREALNIAQRMAGGERRFVKELSVTLLFALREYERAKEVSSNLGEYYKGDDVVGVSTVGGIAIGLVGLLAGDPSGLNPLIQGIAVAELHGAIKEELWEADTFKQFEQIVENFRVAKIAFETRQFDQARDGYRKLLASPLLREWKSIQATIHHDLAKLEMESGDDSKAIEHLYAAIDQIEGRRANFTLAAERMGFVADKQGAYVDLVDLLVRRGRHDEAWEVAERAKARTLVELLAGQKRFAVSPESERIAAHLEELDRDERSGIDAAYYRKLSDSEGEGKGPAVPEKRGLARLADSIRETDPRTAALVTVIPPRAKSMQRHLGRDETLVEYFGYDDRYFIMVVDSSRVRVIRMNARGLAADVEAFRTALQHPDGARYGLHRLSGTSAGSGLEAAGKRLSERIWRPVAPYVRTRQITFVPHGPLHYLPFGALPATKGRLLIDTHTVRLLPSASVLTFLSARPSGGRGALVLGNPDLGNPRLDLPYAQEEAGNLAKVLPDSRVLVRGEATETAVKRFGSSFARVHLASHGVFDTEHPLRSRLLLAGDSENDGSLTVAELFQTKLDIDLVVLSACETGLGKVASGDDVVGFTRGFLYSGARSIVSSLWKVDDRATSVLMEHFYTQLKMHGDKLRALRDAQQQLRKSGYAHPYYWAAFNVIGGKVH